MRRILVIDEGSPGHLTQSRGLARALAARLDAEVEVYAVRLALRGIFRPLLKVVTGMARQGLPDWLLRLAYRMPESSPGLCADVIVTSGGRGLYFATSLARRLGCALVYCGDPAPLPASWCDVILSPAPISGHARVVTTELLVTEISPDRVAGRGADYRDPGTACLGALLIGGDSRSHRYGEADWDALIRGVNQLGERGWRWLLSTSRRTPPAVEKRLRAGIDARYIVKAVWWHMLPERVMLDYLGAADVVLVTQDSLSMLSEAIAAGKPAVALVPADTRPSAFIESVLAPQAARHRMVRLPVDSLGGWEYQADAFEVVDADLASLYAGRVAAFLIDRLGSRTC
ncbi:MAG: ELM1/GtrOC1 family putative glycosyltransferase [Hydrogenophilaceae bacterium]